MAYVHSLIPKGIHISLAGDSEFGNVDLLRQLDVWEWDYALRLKSTRRFMPYGVWRLLRLDRQKPDPGEMRWLGRVNLTMSNPYITNLVVQLETMDNSRNAEPPARNLGNRAAPRQKLPPDKAKSSATLPLGI
jgi:hypothetical protein